MKYGMSFALMALEEAGEVERERTAAIATAMRVARWASNEDFQKFVNELNDGGAQEPKPISDADIAAIFG